MLLYFSAAVGTPGNIPLETLDFLASIAQGSLFLPPCRAAHLTSSPAFLLFFFFKFIYLLFLAALGLRCCVQAFSSCGERGLLFVAVRRLLIAVASLVVEHGPQARGLQ